MNKQNLLSVSVSRLSIVVVLSALLTLSANAKQQTVLLGADGKPLSNDILLLLSNSSDKLLSLNKSKDDKTSKKGNGKEESIDSLTAKNTKATKKIKYHPNPLYEKELLEVMKSGNTTRVTQLIRAKVRPTYRNYKGETPVGIAVSKGWASIVVDLFELGADVNEKGSQGLTLLHVAAANNAYDIAKLLVKKGIDPATKTKIGWTPLHVAARYGHWKLVQYFLKLGVDPNTKNDAGRTALDLAINLKHQGIIHILSRVTSEKSLNQIRMENLKVVRMANHKKRLEKLEKLKEFRRLNLGMKKKKKR